MQFSFQAPINAMNLIVINLNNYFELLCSFHFNYFIFHEKLSALLHRARTSKAKRSRSLRLNLTAVFGFMHTLGASVHFHLPPIHSTRRNSHENNLLKYPLLPNFAVRLQVYVFCVLRLKNFVFYLFNIMRREVPDLQAEHNSFFLIHSPASREFIIIILLLLLFGSSLFVS